MFMTHYGSKKVETGEWKGNPISLCPYQPVHCHLFGFLRRNRLCPPRWIAQRGKMKIKKKRKKHGNHLTGKQAETAQGTSHLSKEKGVTMNLLSGG